MNHRTLVIDIETVGSSDPAVVEQIAAGIKAPATYKKPESIAEWEATQKPLAVDEAVSKTSFDGAWGHIVCIGWKVGHEPARSLEVSNIDDEADMLVQFWSEMRGLFKQGDNILSRPRIIGHNVNSFDLRYLKQRSIVLGCVWPSWFPFDSKPWESDRVFDTMTEFAGVGNRISLDKLAKVLGHEGKGEVSGADVWPMFKAGRIEEIAKYCREDVEMTHAVYKSMMSVMER